jgi:hypothetical protein
MPMKKQPTAERESPRPVVSPPRDLPVPAPTHERLDVDGSDLILPYLKLLQGLSPEVKEDPRKYIQGEWFHTILDECLGSAIRVNVLGFVKSIELWAPREMNEVQPLARSLDCIHWDRPHHTFTVKHRGQTMIWNTGADVASSGLNEFGTSDPSNPRSAPAAAETFRLFLNLIEQPEASPVVYVASRTAVRPVKEMLTKLAMTRSVPHWAHVFDLKAVTQITGPNSYFVPSFKGAGRVTDAVELDRLRELAQMAKEAGERQMATAFPDTGEAGRGTVPF